MKQISAFIKPIQSFLVKLPWRTRLKTVSHIRRVRQAWKYADFYKYNFSRDRLDMGMSRTIKPKSSLGK